MHLFITKLVLTEVSEDHLMGSVEEV